jgi:peptide-methionine (R)-S-oxide reductase
MNNAKTDKEKINKTEDQWRQQLTPEQFCITRQHGTERAFTGKYWDEHAAGTYHCVACGQALFSSDTKFDSGTGWPSFFAPIDEAAVETDVDRSHLMKRTEVHCSRCNAHLGHIFEDGPPPTHLRFCLNSTALELKKKEG